LHEDTIGVLNALTTPVLNPLTRPVLHEDTIGVLNALTTPVLNPLTRPVLQDETRPVLHEDTIGEATLTIRVLAIGLAILTMLVVGHEDVIACAHV
jgi:hypothetical protein